MQIQLVLLSRAFFALLVTQLSFGIVETKAESVIGGEPRVERAVSADEIFYGTRPPISNAARIWDDNDGFDMRSDVVDSGWSNQQAAISKLISPTTPSPLTTINWTNQDVTITGSGATILNLRNFILNGSTLTLEGTAATSFIINVSNQFSLSNGAKVVLAGGIQLLNVTFNVPGKNGPVVVDDESLLTGVLVAQKRTVQVSDYSTIIGHVTAKKIKLVLGSIVVSP